MKKLMVNIDHVATLRQARGTHYPEPVYAASIAETAGASGIIVHLREDRRHINDRDVKILREVVKTKLNLEMAATDEMVAIARDIKPDMITLVPEKREELTTEGGLDVVGLTKKIQMAVESVKNKGIKVSLFVDPVEKQIIASKEIGADMVEIHTGAYSDALNEKIQDKELKKVIDAARKGKELGLGVNAGHGLHYHNVRKIVAIPEIDELSIGHSIIARAVFTGFEQAVRDMLRLIKEN
ncbi:MAG TPA: pyridoxine 5'-phosphate synthase [Syntrophorhabdaceae bacterium]|jgi:pyridoxine 5-phosphate synthase|nr:pyridoxine 5'-phosphate synthase [Syntrophorhabdaceae bacterium]MDI9561883.1 pyridoxine 5'-phosphate synthase [Pseudomonadota bacterium]OQC50890.1 MAG: Pyridoxine 5'-phosphate synthase [Deltaproteobacteria bacterium ADurb.Bin026]MBP8697616.1 pyridoxine 5'-phosphate synthase [Syntrophorhabdaceae bacterium]MBV6506487.1 Pyridoxine 5'-phosphate synthase [Syntrophorhabdaceae bacterium]